MPNTVLEQCGNCQWAGIMPEDVTQRICRGAPPQVVVLPNQKGLQLSYQWPVVKSNGPICSMFKLKLQLDSIKIDV